MEGSKLNPIHGTNGDWIKDGVVDSAFNVDVLCGRVRCDLLNENVPLEDLKDITICSDAVPNYRNECRHWTESCIFAREASIHRYNDTKRIVERVVWEKYSEKTLSENLELIKFTTDLLIHGKSNLFPINAINEESIRARVEATEVMEGM